MPYNEGPSLDMETIKEPSPETIFVKKPDVQDITNLYYPKFVNTVPGDLNNSDDMNDLSLKDLTKTVSDYGDKFMDMIGFGNKPENKQIQPIRPKTTPIAPEESDLLSEINKESPKLENNLSSKTNTKALQNYMANPDDDLRSLVGDKKYEGPIDGVKNDEIEGLSRYLELSIAKIIGNKEVLGVVMNTHVGDVKAAVKKVAGYKRYLIRLKVGNMRLDDRFVELTKFIK